jgi:hypothetical protein
MEFSLADPHAAIRRVFDNTDAELHDQNEIWDGSRRVNTHPSVWGRFL